MWLFFHLEKAGLSDLVLIGYNYVYIALSNGKRFERPVKWSENDYFTARGGWARYGSDPLDGVEQRFVFDVNGDGRADLVGLDDKGGIYAALSIFGKSNIFGSVGRITYEFTAANSSRDNPNNSNDRSRFKFADVNGDGLADAIRLSMNGIEVGINKGSFTSISSYFTPAKRWDDPESVWDPKDDDEWSWVDTPYEKNLANYLDELTPYTFSDINGDGLGDFVLFTNNSGVRVAFSTGKKFLKPVTVSDDFDFETQIPSHVENSSDDIPWHWEGDPCYDHVETNSIWSNARQQPRYLADVNKDGLSDIVGFGSDGVYVALSQGNSFSKATQWIDDHSFSSIEGWCEGENQRMLADFTGDGLPDIIGIGDDGTHTGQNLAKSLRIEQIIAGGYIPKNGATNYKGLHRSIDIEYDVLTTSENYIRSEGHIESPRGLPLYVVTAHHDSDGDIGSVRPKRSTLEYRYHDFNIDPYHGMQGFRSREVIDRNAGTRTQEYYHQYYPMTGRAYYQETFVTKANGQEVKVNAVATNEFPSGAEEYPASHDLPDGVHEILLVSSIETDFDLKTGKRYKQSLTAYSNYDECGQAGSISTSLGHWNGNTLQPYEANYTVTTENTYPKSGSCRDRSRLKSSEVTHAVTEQPAVTKHSKFIYRYDGLLYKEIVEPESNNEQKLTTTYTYNSVGQVTRKTVNGLGGRINKENSRDRSAAINRTTKTAYTSDYRFVSSKTDPMGLVTSFEYDKRFGLVKKVTDPNGLVSQKRYNGFGQLYLEESPQGGVVHTQYAWCDRRIQEATARYCVTKRNLNVATDQYSKKYFDSVDRLLREETLVPDTNSRSGRVVYKDSVYDRDTGRLLKESKPYYSDAPSYSVLWVSYDYDALGRILTVRQADNSKTNKQYEGLTTITTNSKGQVKKETRTPRGNVVKVVDAIGGRVEHIYNSLGHLKSTTVTASDSKGNTRSVETSFKYDLRGNKIQMNDPNMGTWNYYYNALGELTMQVDAKQQAIVMTYDKLGRKVKREAFDELTTWNYYAASGSVALKNRGRLQSVKSAMQGKGRYIYEKSFVYDNYGKPLTVYEKLPRQDSDSYHNYKFTRSYDQWGRLKTLTYPKVSSDQPTVGVTYEYDDSLGHLKAVADKNNSSFKHWEMTAQEADGQLKEYQLADGKVATTHYYDLKTRRIDYVYSRGPSGAIQYTNYDFDSLGNLEKRQDYKARSKETFQYDDLNRLIQTETKYSGINTPIKKVNKYDGHGNFISKNGVNYTYDSEAGGFHQASQVMRSDYSSFDILGYDANGNVNYMGVRNNLRILWTSFNKIARYSPNGRITFLLYNSAHQRMHEDSGVGKTWYAGGGLLEHFKAHDADRETMKYTLMVNGESIGYITQSFKSSWTPSTGFKASNLTEQTYYFSKDHLGSVSALLDKRGRVLERLSFGAWGKRRAASWNPNEVATPALDLLNNYALTQGFTGHEADHELGFINMKGRVYDPKLGRFLSADPFVQFPNNTQSYNRYSYVLNNPLSYTDPSGYFLSGVRNFVRENFEVVRTVVAIATTILTAGAGLPAVIAVNAASAFTLTGLATGSLQAATQAAIMTGVTTGFSAVLTQGVAAHVSEGFWGIKRGIAHGVAQGLVSELHGGKFRSGFAAAFVGHVSGGLGERWFGKRGSSQGVVGRTVIAATAGGVVSERTGGKFANGAITAAFVHLFNSELTAKWREQALIEDKAIPNMSSTELRQWKSLKQEMALKEMSYISNALTVISVGTGVGTGIVMLRSGSTIAIGKLSSISTFSGLGGNAVTIIASPSVGDPVTVGNAVRMAEDLASLPIRYRPMLSVPLSSYEMATAMFDSILLYESNFYEQ